MPVNLNDTAVLGGNATLHLENPALDLFHAGSVCSLATLAAEINAEHDAAETHARKAIDHARAAGEKLLQAKAGVAHGQWLPWLTANCPRLSIRRSQEYMRVAREWPALQAKYADSAHLTIDGALALLAEPTPATGCTLQPFFCGLPVSAPASSVSAPADPELPKPDSPVEKINREHQQSLAKAREAARHELTFGKLLLTVKAGMNDEQWAVWLAEQQQSGMMKFSVHEAAAAVRTAEESVRKAAELVESLKGLRLWFPERESLLGLVTAEDARTIRRHWLVEDAAEAQKVVARRIEDLRGQPDMPRWLQVDSLMRALEEADTAARRVKTWPNEPGETDKRAFFERAKAMLATTEVQP